MTLKLSCNQQHPTHKSNVSACFASSYSLAIDKFWLSKKGLWLFITSPWHLHLKLSCLCLLISFYCD